MQFTPCPGLLVHSLLLMVKAQVAKKISSESVSWNWTLDFKKSLWIGFLVYLQMQMGKFIGICAVCANELYMVLGTSNNCADWYENTITHNICKSQKCKNHLVTVYWKTDKEFVLMTCFFTNKRKRDNFYFNLTNVPESPFRRQNVRWWAFVDKNELLKSPKIPY